MRAKTKLHLKVEKLPFSKIIFSRNHAPSQIYIVLLLKKPPSREIIFSRNHLSRESSFQEIIFGKSSFQEITSRKSIFWKSDFVVVVARGVWCVCGMPSHV